MKKIIVPLMALMITFGLLGIGTYGVFALPEDTNIIDHGQLALNVQGTNTANESYSFENIKPGDFKGWDGAENTGGMFWTVKNTGSLDGSLEISIEGIGDNTPGLSTQIKTQLKINDLMVSESSNLDDLPVFKRALASGETIKVDIGWIFKETAGNEYQGASTTFDVKFYLTAPSAEDAVSGTVIPAESPTLPPPLLEVASITESFIEVLAFTGLKPITYIAGLILIIAGILLFIITCIKKTILN